MAREFARLLLSIRDDPDWRSLTCVQQSVYCSIIASRDLSWAGVAPNLPARFADWSDDLTLVKVRATMRQLADRRFIVIDDATDEVLVRTYIRHDGIVAKPNITRAMVKAYATIHSEQLRVAIQAELWRQYEAEPELRGWSQIEHMDAEMWSAIRSYRGTNLRAVS